MPIVNMRGDPDEKYHDAGAFETVERVHVRWITLVLEGNSVGD